MNNEWEEQYCFTNVKVNAYVHFDIIVLHSSKEHYVEKHCQIKHKSLDTNFPINSEIMKIVSDLKANLTYQQSLFTRPIVKLRNATITSSKTVCRIEKEIYDTFEDRELLKEE